MGVIIVLLLFFSIPAICIVILYGWTMWEKSKERQRQEKVKIEWAGRVRVQDILGHKNPFDTASINNPAIKKEYEKLLNYPADEIGLLLKIAEAQKSILIGANAIIVSILVIGLIMGTPEMWGTNLIVAKLLSVVVSMAIACYSWMMFIINPNWEYVTLCYIKESLESKKLVSSKKRSKKNKK
ncbi:hypothetical protein QJV45_13945 [Listeria booriae]|uniref:hypothetical protein n=1 Tax=Listeria booriae TaxID=1552123 RepID=UPI001E45FE23|nr:hypothetical protein [Listeria booriae]MCD2208786.1 hypothetical protein [Listeria booriae]MDT0111580.1 hypothetical protein [Listeria booriae]